MSAIRVLNADLDGYTRPEPRLYLVGGTAVAGRDAGARVPSKGATLQVTRRGRLAATVSCIAVLAVIVYLAASLMAPASAGVEVVVEPGQTLSEIASRHLPQMSVDRAVVEVQLANRMNTTQVQTGQVLTIP